MAKLNEIQVVSYSPKQGCFYIEPMSEYLECNLFSIVNGQEPQYMALNIFKTTMEASYYIESIRGTVNGAFKTQER